MVKNLKPLRRQKGISQQQLADAVGVSQQSVNKYENHGVEPDLETLMRMADYLGTSVDALIGYTSSSDDENELTSEERRLVDGYRRLNAQEKEIVRLLLVNHKE